VLPFDGASMVSMAAQSSSGMHTFFSASALLQPVAKAVNSE